MVLGNLSMGDMSNQFPSANVVHVMVALMIAGLVSATPVNSAELERLGPKAEASIYWVGHSLVENKAQSGWGEIDLMTVVGRFAEARMLSYHMGNHTLWGSPMSALWRGGPHGYERDASAMVPKREEFQRNAGQYDTLVVTESLPVAWAVANEYSAYYLRRFACTLKAANSQSRIYLYQTWVNLQGGDQNAYAPPVHSFDWRAAMVAQRKVWEELADEASGPEVRAPGGWFERFGWNAKSNGGCDSAISIFIVPVGRAFVALADRLAASEEGVTYTWADGRQLALTDLFANPYENSPDYRPAYQATAPGGFKLRNSQEPHDDIHASGLGIYFAALVHFATIYRQSPVGLPAPDELGEALARTLQCIAWSTVVRDGRSGVLGEVDCTKT